MFCFLKMTEQIKRVNGLSFHWKFQTVKMISCPLPLQLITQTLNSGSHRELGWTLCLHVETLTYSTHKSVKYATIEGNK